MIHIGINLLIKPFLTILTPRWFTMASWGNAMAPDAVRQGIFVQLLMSLNDSERDSADAKPAAISGERETGSGLSKINKQHWINIVVTSVESSWMCHAFHICI